MVWYHTSGEPSCESRARRSAPEEATDYANHP